MVNRLQPDLTLQEGKLPANIFELTVDDSHPVTCVSDRYLSFALDTSQLVGGKWWDPAADGVEHGSGTLHAPLFDFNRSRLDMLVRALSPAYLRLGGSEADKVYYDLHSTTAPSVPPGYHSVLTRSQWDAACEFTRRNNLGLIFTLNAGPAARNRAGTWQSQNAGELLAYTSQNGHRVDVWELGNEVNVFFSVHGWRNQVKPGQYAADLKIARQLVDHLTPDVSLAVQGSAFWPVLGELPIHGLGFMPRVLKLAGKLIDQVVWHYYPQQSRRGPAAIRRATPTRLLDPNCLDEAGHWAGEMIRIRDQYAPGKPLWLGETGNAQFGGEPGVSDSYIGGLWWLDQLGLLARCGHQVVVRQTLVGMDYGMLDDDLTPRPDYWNSLFWKRLMGQKVYSTQVRGERRDLLRAYAHSTGNDPNGSLTLLLLNLDRQRSARIRLPQFSRKPYNLYAISAPSVTGRQVLLNGRILELQTSVPDFRPLMIQPDEVPEISLNPLAYAFIVMH